MTQLELIICTCLPGKDQDETTTLCPACVDELHQEYKHEKVHPAKGMSKANYSLNGREVTDITTEGPHDELFVIEAIYADTLEPLDDDELDKLCELYYSELAQDAYESAIDHAMDMLEDR